MFKPYLPVVYLSLCLVFVSATDDNELLVVCPPKSTCIRGVFRHTYNTEFEAFMGMPYALAPLGELRFRIYGGGFNSGSASYLYTGPEYFMATQSVILVTVSYRLGALGFLSTGDNSISGNFGLKDQHMALKWVQENIADFGGDKDKVTLFGHGAGAIATHLHLMNPNSEGLFHRVISMSGTANSPYAIERNPLEKARNTAFYCNIENVDHISTTKLSKALRKVNALKLVEAEDYVKRWVGDPNTYYRPVIEPPGKNAFLTQDPEELIRTVNYTKLPWLLGTVPEDGAKYWSRCGNKRRRLNHAQHARCATPPPKPPKRIQKDTRTKDSVEPKKNVRIKKLQQAVKLSLGDTAEVKALSDASKLSFKGL
ncbi:uncharacterized protein Dwil_GK27634 [Drosophila willistoni]|nr:uncharacterized protein Dwil_GK27634 [Drosophila willistoni]